MKIGVASEKETENSKVSNTTGRAPYYLIFEDKKLIKKIKNPFARGGGGAGFGVAQMLKNENVELAIIGKLGPNAKSAFDSKKIETVNASDMKVKEALDKYA